MFIIFFLNFTELSKRLVDKTNEQKAFTSNKGLVKFNIEYFYYPTRYGVLLGTLPTVGDQHDNTKTTKQKQNPS